MNARLGELGIEVNTGKAYLMPENPVKPAEEDFADKPYGFEQMQKEFEVKQNKWNALQKMFKNGLADKVLEYAKKLIRDYDIPPSEITPFEDAMMDYIQLPYLNIRYHELFGLTEERKMTEEERFKLYPALTGEQKGVLKRDLLIHLMSQTLGVNIKSALLLEYVRCHFPDEIASIEYTHLITRSIQKNIKSLRSKWIKPKHQIMKNCRM